MSGSALSLTRMTALFRRRVYGPSDSAPQDGPPRARPHLTVVEGGSNRPRPRRRLFGKREYPLPVVTLTLLVVIVAIFAAMWIVGNHQVNTVARQFGDKDNGLIRQGQWWRMITAVFLHGNLTHLMVNGISLLWLGGQMESIYGSRKYLLVFMAGGVMGNILSFCFNPQPSLGASGAIFGLVGAGIVFPFRYRRYLPEEVGKKIVSQLAMVALINFSLGFMMHGIDNWAHLGGLIGGGLAALVLMPEVLEERRSRNSDIALTAAVGAVLITLVCGATAQWRWAARNTSPLMNTFKPSGENAWWTLDVPRDWKQETGLVWRSPRNAQLKVREQESKPGLRPSPGAAPNFETLVIDGKETKHQRLIISQTVLDIYLIQAAPDRQISLVFTIPAAAFPEVEREILYILAGIRFVHVPAPRQG